MGLEGDAGMKAVDFASIMDGHVEEGASVSYILNILHFFLSSKEIYKSYYLLSILLLKIVGV